MKPEICEEGKAVKMGADDVLSITVDRGLSSYNTI